MERRLSVTLRDRIKTFDRAKPYVWKLRLSKADFEDLETCITATVNESGVSTLTKPENAIITIVYMAEWYKREYQGGNRNELIENLNFETLWNNSGINQNVYLYRDDNGNRRWQYSIYVLGGLSIQHELNRNDNMKFLKGLCRIYHGEDYSFDEFDDSSRAVAFRDSIKKQHSLYEYMKEILNGDIPFHPDDVADERTRRFISYVEDANKDILRIKFRFEWIVNFNPDHTYINRRLNVWFKPEEVGGGLHHYLGNDRLRLWNVPHPDQHLHLNLYVRFKNGDDIVGPSTMDRPIVSFLNHGVNEFVAFGADKGVQIKQIPTCRFDKVELFLKDDNGEEYLAQTYDVKEYMQLWRSDEFSYQWSNTKNSQKETALLFSSNCHLAEDSINLDIINKQFKSQEFGIGEAWNWVYIHNYVKISDETHILKSFFNLIGYYQVTTRLYSNTIHYSEGGKICHYYMNDPEESEEYDIESLPLIFSKEDIIVNYFRSKDDIINGIPEPDIHPDYIEYKKRGERLFSSWSDEVNPPYGVLTLRVTVKSKAFVMDVIYLPSYSIESPILRDFNNCNIKFKDFEENTIDMKDSIPMDGIVLEPTLTIQFKEEDNSYYEVSVYRPTCVKEILFDGRIIQYLNGNDKLNLPYIFKDRVHINDFSESGYQSYDCKNLCNIYTDTYLNIAGNPDIGMAAIARWEDGSNYSGKLLDPLAPECLLVCFGLNSDAPHWDGQEAIFWNYDKGNDPSIISPTENIDFGIIFQNLSKNKDLTCNYPILMDDDPWGFDGIEVSFVRCFEIANEADTYFFLMKPLREMPKNEIIREIYEPLLKERDGYLTDKDKKGLIRLGEELGFDWQANNIIISNN